MKRGLVCVLAILWGCSDDGTAGVGDTDTGAQGTTSSGGTDAGGTMEFDSTGPAGTSDTSGGSSTTAGPLTTATDGTGSDGASTGGSSGPGVIYVNFEGGDFTPGMDNAAENQSAIIMNATTLEAYAGTKEDRATILATIEADFTPFAITVTDQRPDAGDYTMVVITPTNFLQAGVNGIAALDCNNNNPNDIPFAFTDTLTDPVLIGSVASGRIGSTYGTENTSDATDLSYGAEWSPGDDPSWVDSCIATDFDQACVSQHAPHCPEGQQNSFAALTDLFG